MILSAIVFLPLFFAVIVAVWPNEKTVRPLSLGLAVIHFLLSLGVLLRYDSNSPALQMVEQYVWINRFGISYFLGVDGISLWLLLLTTFLTPVVVLASWTSIDQKVRGFHSALFVLVTAMLGTFLAIDAVFFYVFWELSLIPMYFIIGIWGGQRRIYASVKFFIYTMVGSVLMLAAIIYMMFITEQSLGTMSSSLLDFYRVKGNLVFIGHQFFNPQNILFFAFALAFAIKIPVFPFHTWLPDAHVEAPTPGSVILAAVMLKMGSYGLMRWAIPLFPDAAEYWASLFFIIGTVGIIYGALMAMVQPDVKKLVAYSSVSHMGYILVGLFTFNAAGASGSLYQMLNHGVSTGALFLLVGMIYERTHSREIDKYGGLAGVLPLFTICFFVVTLSSIAVPMTNGFIGEFLILLGSYEAQPVVTYFAVSGVVLGAVYMLWMFKRVFFGAKSEMVSDSHHPLIDLNSRELVVMAPFIALIFWMGLKPNQFLDFSKASIEHLVNHRHDYQLAIVDSSKPTAVQTSFNNFRDLDLVSVATSRPQITFSVVKDQK